MTIDAVLFDYSGVLTTGFELGTDDAPYDMDVLFAEMAKALMGAEPHPWHEIERGEISLDDWVSYIERLVPGAGALFSVESDHNVMAALELLDVRIDLVRELKATGKRVGVVTNNVAEWEHLWRPGLPADLFEVIIDSAQVGCRKPEAAIYELAMQRLGIDDAASVMFIDDFEWNVTGAEAVGMVGIHCTPDIDLRAAVHTTLGE